MKRGGMMGIKERLYNEVAEGIEVSLSLRHGEKITGRILSYVDEGVYFERLIPYEQINDYIVLQEKENVTIDEFGELEDELVGPKKDETVAICRKDGTLVTGRYVGEDVTVIRMENDGRDIVEEKANIEYLYLCGVITAYNLLNKSGVVNNKHKFNKSMVDTSSSIFKRLDKDDPREKNMYMCLYKLEKKGEDNPSITALDDFDDIKEQIGWQEGTITAAPAKSSYFTVDKEARCYFSIVDDETLLRYRKDDDLQEQDVIYKEVYHRIGDDKRKPDVPAASIIDIRSKCQIGKTKRDNLTNTITIQCGKYRYRYRGKELPEDIFVVAELGVDDDGREYAARIIACGQDKNELKLPTHRKELQKRRDALERERKSAEKRENYREQFYKTKELLENSLWAPEDAFADMLKASLNAKRANEDEDALESMESALQDYGYLLPANLLSVFRMQMAYLQGEFEEARKQANWIMQASGQYKAEILLQAKSVKSGIGNFPTNELAAWIIHSGQNGLVGTIDAFDANTDTGRISVDTQQFVFHWKDVESAQIDEEFDLRDKKFEFKKNRYIVSFCKVDNSDSKKLEEEGASCKAIKIKLQDVCPLRMTVRQDSFMGDDFDDELETIFNLPTNKLLEYKLEQYSLNDIKEFLTIEEQNRICEGIYIGIPTTRKAILNAMDKLHDKNEWDDKFFSQPVPKKEKSRLLLARAKIISQYLQSDDFSKYGPIKGVLDKDTKNRALYEYAYDYIYDAGKNGKDKPAGTMAYYASSILSAPGFSEEKKKRVADMCIARYYQGGWTTQWDNNGTDAKSFATHLRQHCKDVNGLVRMILSFPEYIFDELLELPQYEGMVQVLWEKVPQIKDLFGATPQKQVQRFYDMWNKTKKSFVKKLTITGTIRKDAKRYLNWLKESGDGFVDYLFAEEEELIKKLKKQFLDLMQNTDDESPTVQHSKLPSIYKVCHELLEEIDDKPTKFSYEELRPFILNLCENIASYLEKLYQDNAPEITIEHCSLMEEQTKEVLCLTNAAGKLRAENIHVEISPCEGSTAFMPEDFKADPGEAIEIVVPIGNVHQGAQQMEMYVHIKYDYLSGFDRKEGEGIWQTISPPFEVQISIPLSEDAVDLIPKHKNPYSRYAGGKAMGPMDEDMFFGRVHVIDAIFRDIMREDGKSIDAGKMTAFYGQKRSGKTSIMNFLKAKIEKANPKAIVLTINAQDFLLENNKPLLFMQKMLAAVIKDLKKAVLNPRYKELREDLKLIPLEIPNPKGFVDNPSAEITFLDFFGEFNARFGEEYPIVLMVDEFTQVYVNLKENKIQNNFLNQWRALVTEANFANVFVGQDFMPKFFEDPTIAQNVNGLATTSMHEIGYLERDAAYEMMEKPIRKKDGSSRFQGKLGEEAKKKIFNLTGGSAFYLMKFMNGLVGYMINKHNDLITPSLVEKVVEKYIFVTQDNPIEKKDFDPIYNEYSSSLVLREKPKAADTLRGQEETAKRVYQFFKELARCAIEHEKEDGVFCVNDVQWEDKSERDKIIRTLRDRRILVDREGNDIVGKEVKDLKFKVKVGIFIEFLKRRVLNQDS